MMDLMTRRAVFALMIVLAIGFVACGSEQAPNSGSAQDVDVIVARARDAMGKVTSYRTTGEWTQTSYDSPEPESFQQFTEWVAPDRHRLRLDSPPDGDGLFNEIIRIGDQIFTHDDHRGWQEQPRYAASLSDADRLNTVAVRPGDPAMLLDVENLELVGEDLFEGAEVFRLVGHTSFERGPVAEGQPDSFKAFTETVTTLLIDRLDYRLALLIAESEIRFTVLKTMNGVESQEEGRASSFASSRFFDYDEPVTIEIPTENVRLLEDNPLATPVPPPATPTAVPAFNCSDSGASWPGCGVRTAADVEVMLAVFPAENKLAAGEDAVITFPFDGPPSVDWQAEAFIWHVQSASVVRLCVRNSARAWKSNSPAATARFDQVLANKTLMDEIRSRMSHVEGRCVFSG